MAELEDYSELNTFTLKVQLPILSQSPATIFFTVTFFCNGYTLVSEEFDNADDALDWAQDELGSFGDWTLEDDNWLVLSESLCGVGSLTVQQRNEASQGEDGLVLYLDDSSPQAITDIFGITFSDISVDHKRFNDTTFINHMIECNPIFSDEFPDPEGAQWWHTTSGTENGNGILESETSARGKPDPETYAYSFITDYANTLQAIGIIQTVLTVNLASLLIQVMNRTRPINASMISFTTFFAQFTYIKNLFTSKGITIRSVQLCTELGIRNQDDIVKESNDVKVVCDEVISWLHTNYPAITSIVSDAYQADDNSPFLDDYQSTMNALDTSGVRNYFQFDDSLDTYQKNRDRIAGFHDYVSALKELFPDKDIHFRQAAIQTGNPMRLKVGTGLIISELYMKVVNENLMRSGLIKEFPFYNLNTLINQNNVTFPALDFVKLIRNVWDNDGKISATLDNSDLIVLSVKQASYTETFIVNPTGEFVPISQVQLNDVAVDVEVETLYGNPLDSAASTYSATGAEALIYPYSLTKITTS